eukprot:scaffold151625_cov17-Tisochrysis_lutea.AAC.3
MVPSMETGDGENGECKTCMVCILSKLGSKGTHEAGMLLGEGTAHALSPAQARASARAHLSSTPSKPCCSQTWLSSLAPAGSAGSEAGSNTGFPGAASRFCSPTTSNSTGRARIPQAPPLNTTERANKTCSSSARHTHGCQRLAAVALLHANMDVSCLLCVTGVLLGMGGP